MAGQPGWFDLDERYAALSAAGDPLERLASVVDFELFRADLDAALDRSDRAKGGRPPYDAVVMFNQTYKADPDMGRLMATKDFRIAMSHAVDRDQIRENGSAR